MEPAQKPTQLDKPLILLDMDGVLCDFVTEALQVMFDVDIISDRLGVILRRWREQTPGEWDICKVAACSNEDMWRAIHGEGKDFWCRLEEMPLYPRLRGFSQMLESEGRANVMVASSPSNHASSYAGKFEWLKSRRINAHSHAMLGSQKHLLAAPGRILVDDNDTNCRKFREHGGRAVLVPQIWNSLHAIASDSEQAQWEYVESQLLEQLEYANLDLGR